MFATLDPTLRRSTLPHGTEVLFSDTVGFVSDLPTHLVAAFRATLEEVMEARNRVAVFVTWRTPIRSFSRRTSRRSSPISTSTLTTPITSWRSGTRIDLLDEAARQHLEGTKTSLGDDVTTHLVSAVTGEGTAGLLADMEHRIAGRLSAVRLDLDPDTMSILPWLYDNATVTDREDGEDGHVALTVEITTQARAELRRLSESLPGLSIEPVS